MNIKTSLSVSRASNDKIMLRITDEASHERILEMAIEPADFARLITGLYLANQKAELGNLDRVGKEKVSERRSVLCPLNTYDRGVLEQWIRENVQEQGWTVDASLRSQHSIHHENEGTLLNYHVFKFVDQSATDEPS